MVASSPLRTTAVRAAIGRAVGMTRGLSGTATRPDGMAAVLRAAGGSEAEHYLNMFRTNKTPAFAVVKVGGDVVEYELDTLVETCASLHNLDLMPVVVHGGGPQMNDELKRVGVEPQYIQGSRVTDAATLEVAERIFTELNQRVADALRDAGVGATPLPKGIFKAEIRSPEFGFVGEVNDVVDGPILESLAAKSIPVLTSLGIAKNGQVLNINADVAARDLVQRLQPMRVLFASAKGGWLDDETNEIVSVVDLANDYQDLASLDYNGRQGTLLKLNEIKAILDKIPESSAVSITSAGTMLQELFTHKGAGTLFRKGQPVTKEREGVFVYPNKARATVTAHPSLGAGLPPVVDSFECSDAGVGYEDAVWKAIKKEHESVAWTFGPNTPKDSVLARSEDQADVVLRKGRSGVAYYNSGHDLTGWNVDGAKRLLNSTAEPNASVASSAASSGFAAPSGPTYKVGLLGARGYVGREFVKLLCNHPHMELTVASSRALAGQRVIDCFNLDESAADSGVAADLCFQALEPEDLVKDPTSQEVDIWVLALPNGLAPRFVDPLERSNPNAVMIDLGADYRFTDEWAYGLPERHGARELIKGAKRISNPGCYATGAQAALMPVLQPLAGSPLRLAQGMIPSVFGVSGYSGAGTNPSDKNDPENLADNLIPYSLVNHMHERECTRHLKSRIGFMPHVASWFQGIHLTTTMHLDSAPDTDAILEAYQKYYEGQPLVRVTASAPSVKENMLQHDVRVGGFTLDKESGRLVVISTIDNLLKGAATQAVQNLNIALGVQDEYAGIPLPKA